MLLFSLSLLLSYLIFFINCKRIDWHWKAIVLILIRIFKQRLFQFMRNSSSLNIQSNPCLHANNNALDIEEIPKRSPHRLVRSSIDMKNLEEFHSKPRAIRIESALLIGGYSLPLNPSFRHPSLMNIKRNGAGDEIHSTYSIDKQVQTTNWQIDRSHYLTLESVPISHRRTSHFTPKQLLFISFSVFLVVIFLCLGVINLFF